MNSVVVVEYEAEWPSIFERVRARVWPAMHDRALSVEHVGSTSVEGLRYLRTLREIGLSEAECAEIRRVNQMGALPRPS
jgi:hypothetical protein